jgi:hypothetical protein
MGICCESEPPARISSNWNDTSNFPWDPSSVNYYGKCPNCLCVAYPGHPCDIRYNTKFRALKWNAGLRRHGFI